MTTAAGKYRRRVTIQQLVQTPDGSGGFQTSWQPYISVWADIQAYVSKRSIDEKWIASQLEANTIYQVTTRYQAGISADMQMVYGSHVFNIRSVTDVDMRHVELLMLVEELQTVATG